MINFFRLLGCVYYFKAIITEILVLMSDRKRRNILFLMHCSIKPM